MPFSAEIMQLRLVQGHLDTVRLSGTRAARSDSVHEILCYSSMGSRTGG